MLAIPLKYNWRNLFVRKITTGLTVLGIGLVVAVFLCVMALGEGLTRVFTASGSDQNVLVLRQNSQSELQSGIGRDQVPLIETLPGIAKDTDGKPLASPELVVVVNLEKQGGGSSNVTIRGVGEKAVKLRNMFDLDKGRMFEPGKSEVVVSRSVARRFTNCDVGQTIRFGAYRWTVVGLFDAGGTAPDSEIWTDVEGMASDFKRNGYSSVLARTADRAGRDQFLAGLAGDPRLALEGKIERKYYDEQTSTAAPIKFLGVFVGVVMAIGACFGAMNTMYAAVSARTREIATLRALGFGRLSIMTSFVLESIVLALLGGVLGCALGWLAVKLALSGVTGTTNFATFSEVVFAFRLTPELMATGMVFSLAMGFFGGVFPAGRAAFTKITDALRQVG
ncbi:MAG TPA: ABC transporter permease [Thermoanaerobaculia bacterium]|nr:ABC transporter permease [Thermoanaerobaculia bacterium]HQR66058.1 ABC transporter permease [Thermoanaerobaculia bacterium]